MKIYTVILLVLFINPATANKSNSLYEKSRGYEKSGGYERSGGYEKSSGYATSSECDDGHKKSTHGYKKSEEGYTQYRETSSKVSKRLVEKNTIGK
jgi:hypothetical protein